jgi:NTE family protein
MHGKGAAAPVRRGDPSIAIAFGGGGARGLAHIHAIEALDELGVRPVAISGSSIGAIMGAGMAAGMSGKEIHRYAHSILSRRAEVAARMWRARPGTFAEFMDGGLRVTQFNMERILAAFLPSAIPQTFEELEIPLLVTAVDFFRHEQVVFEAGDLTSAIAASAAIPAVFRPVRRDGRILIDGGICNPVPFDLIEGKADVTIAIDVVGTPTPHQRRKLNSLDLVFGSTQLMMQSIIALKLQTCRPTIFLRPPISRFRVLDFMRIEAIMAQTAPLKDELKRAIDAAFSGRARVAQA